MATISTSGIAPSQIIKSEHLLRIINALDGTTSNDIIISGSINVLEDSTINDVNIGRGGGNLDSNTRVGVGALQNNTTGGNNTAIGNQALRSNTTGDFNTANGNSALGNNTTGINNTANGVGALQSNTTGNQNTANGRNALLSNTTGTSNTAIGRNALENNITGSNNTAVGDNAGSVIGNFSPNSISNTSIFIGSLSRPLNNNESNQIVIGESAIGLGSNTTVLGNGGTVRTAIYGRLLLGATTDDGTNRLQVTGAATISQDSIINGVNIGKGGENVESNTRVGADALSNNTIGEFNTANGQSALERNTTGGSNTANGSQALQNNTTGNLNTANGQSALERNTTGNNNTATGFRALHLHTTGIQNTANGANSGRLISDGVTALTITNNSLFLGADTRALANNQTNQIVIGNGAIGLGSNTVVLGNASISTTALRGKIGIGTTIPESVLHVNQDKPTFILSSEKQIENTIDNEVLADIKFKKHFSIAEGANIKMLQAGDNTSYSNANLAFYTNDGSNGTTFTSTAIERMRITSAGNIGIGTIAPVESAQLQVDSTTRGFLPPRMTTAQINAIASPANGLVVYNTTISLLCFYNGTSWQRVTSAAM